MTSAQPCSIISAPHAAPCLPFPPQLRASRRPQVPAACLGARGPERCTNTKWRYRTSCGRAGAFALLQPSADPLPSGLKPGGAHRPGHDACFSMWGPLRGILGLSDHGPNGGSRQTDIRLIVERKSLTRPLVRSGTRYCLLPYPPFSGHSGLPDALPRMAQRQRRTHPPVPDALVDLVRFS